MPPPGAAITNFGASVWPGRASVAVQPAACGSRRRGGRPGKPSRAAKFALRLPYRWPAATNAFAVQFRCGLLRRRSSWRWIGPARWVALGCGVSWYAAPAQGAESGPISAQIAWQGSACGDAAEFASRILGRTRHVRFVSSGAQLRLAVRIDPHGNALRADVAFLSAGKPAVVRKLESPDCDDALDALALVVAIGVDERWREQNAASGRRAPAVRPRVRQRRPERPPEPAPIEAAEPALDPGEASASFPAITLALPAPAPPRAAPPRPAVPPAPVVSDHGLRWAAGAGARWSQGAAPEPLIGGELWLRASWERGSLLSPELGASLAHDRVSGIERAEGSADFALSAAGLELCPLRLGTQRLRLQPCIASTLGWLQATGRRTFRAHTGPSPWLTIGGGAQAMALVGKLALRVTAGAAHPLEREGFRFHSVDCLSGECDEPAFHRVAPVVWSLGAGAGLSF